MQTNKENTPSKEIQALQSYIGQAVDLLGNDPDPKDAGAFIYLGNPHIAIPHQLLTNERLESDEKIIWALLRESLPRPGHPSLLPSHQQIAKQISKASSVVSERIQVLRLYRWITLCAQVGRSDSGTWYRPIYAIHDEPIPLADTLFLDESYMQHVNQQMKSTTSRIAQTAKEVSNQLRHQIATEDVSISPGPVSRSLNGYQYKTRNNRTRYPETVINHEKESNNRIRNPDAVNNSEKQPDYDSIDDKKIKKMGLCQIE
ncbi:MAG: hypothetical protein L3J70_11305 [Gammaproteobacteria bacterium]|nr:hypothetical protein [Gammaproteobacteria bacterium]